MVESEICNYFRGCKDRADQIDIIHDLTGLSKSKILDVLINNKLITDKDEDYELLIKHCKPVAKPRSSKDSLGVKKSKSSRQSKKQEVKIGPVKEAPSEEIKQEIKREVKREVKREPLIVGNSTINIDDRDGSDTQRNTLELFIMGQMYLGKSSKDIAKIVGVDKEIVDGICEYINKSRTGHSDVLASMDFKDKLTKLYNYTNYIDSFVECKRYEHIPDIVNKQREIINELMCMIKL